MSAQLQGDFHESIPTLLEVTLICQFLEPELCSYMSSIKTLESGNADCCRGAFHEITTLPASSSQNGGGGNVMIKKKKNPPCFSL